MPTNTLYRIIAVAVFIALIVSGVGLFLSNKYSLLGYKNLRTKYTDAGSNRGPSAHKTDALTN
jgi:hypothetical protein